MDSPPESPPTSPRVSRGRTSHACDRCRLKKAKCDGSKPCGRCKAYDVVCIFNDKKKIRQKSHPPGYVELLEVQQSQLIFGLQELFRMVQEKKDWTESMPRRTHQGAPLVHDILEALGAFKESEHSPMIGIEDDNNTFQDDSSTIAFGLSHETDESFAFDESRRMRRKSSARELGLGLSDHFQVDCFRYDSLNHQSSETQHFDIYPDDTKMLRTISMENPSSIRRDTKSSAPSNTQQTESKGCEMLAEGLLDPADFRVADDDSAKIWPIPNTLEGLTANAEPVGDLGINMECLWPANCPMVHLMSLDKQMSINPTALLPNLLHSHNSTPTH